MATIDRIEHIIKTPDGVDIAVSDDVATVTGPNGSLSREFTHHKVQLLFEGGVVFVRVDIPRKKEKALAGRTRSLLFLPGSGCQEFPY